jgi:D-lactate dehydrogenase (cytochrome)
MRLLRGREEVAERAADLLADESGLSGGWAVEAAWPADHEEASDYLRDLAGRGLPATPSGALTGIAAGAVPEGGAVISASRMKDIEYLGDRRLRVGAGVTLDEIDRYLARQSLALFYPPDPTETTASIGGTLATDASGSDSYLYGSTRHWVEAVEMVLPGGERLCLSRGDRSFRDGFCDVPGLGRVQLSEAPRPPLPKNAAGYWIRPGMDLVDLLIGSEGTLGLFTGATLLLRPAPHALVDLAAFPESMEAFWDLFESVCAMESRVRAVEMMDGPCIRLLREHPPEDLPELPEAAAVLLLRAEADDESGLDALLEELDGVLSAAGIPLDETWGGFEETEHRRMVELRHSLPETVNELVSRARRDDPAVHKLGSDAAVDAAAARQLYEQTRKILENMDLPHLVFGHVGQGHLHANVIPRSHHQLEAGGAAMRDIAALAAEMGGTVSAEHGLGRLKAGFLELMLAPEELEGMRDIRRSFDPHGLLCPAVTWA